MAQAALHEEIDMARQVQRGIRARRQAPAQIEPAPVDAFDFPGPGIKIVTAFSPGKSRHGSHFAARFAHPLPPFFPWLFLCPRFYSGHPRKDKIPKRMAALKVARLRARNGTR